MAEVITCDACQVADTNPQTGRTNKGCKECAAREASGSMAMTVALARGKINAQLGWLLEPTWGPDWKTSGIKAAIKWRKRRQGGANA